MALVVVPNLCTYQTRAGELSMWKGCAGPNGARAGIFAALLAREGMSGPFNAFEGVFGIWNQTTGEPFPVQLPVLGESTSYGLNQSNIKTYPVRVSCQLPITTALDLLGRVDVARIESLTIDTYASAYKGAVQDPELWHPGRDTAGDAERAMVDEILHRRELPCSVVAPYYPDNGFVGSLGPFAFRNASKPDGTIDLLLNAGDLHTAIATLGRRNNMAVVGSSASQSLTGSKFHLQDVEAEVFAAADLCIDYGKCTYDNPRGLGSTIVDLRTLEAIRIGCVYDEIRAVVKQSFDVDLRTE